MTKHRKPLIEALVIFDGWGVSTVGASNAILKAENADDGSGFYATAARIRN